MIITGNEFFDVLNMAQIFLTDKLLRTVPAVDLSSQRGEPIIMKNGTDVTYLVQIEKYPFLDPYQPDLCKNYNLEEHLECVDGNLKDYLDMSCRPPWLAKRNACLDMNWYGIANNITLSQLDASVENDLVTMTRSIIYMEDFEEKKSSPVPCSVTRSDIRTGITGRALAGSEVRLVFEDRIKHSENTFGYGRSDFLVDLGSSVGLWFGISVFGLTNMSIVLFKYCKGVFENFANVKNVV